MLDSMFSEKLERDVVTYRRMVQCSVGISGSAWLFQVILGSWEQVAVTM